MKPKKKKIVRENLFEGVPAHIARLYKAVENYVARNGGKVVVIGGIQIQEWPLDGKYKFIVGVSCVGRKPSISIKDEASKK